MTFLHDGNESSRDWDKVEKPAAKKTYKAHDVLVIIDLQLSRFRRATINMYACVSLGWYCLKMRGNLQHRDMDSWHGTYTTNGGWSSTMGIRIIVGGWSSAMNTGSCHISWVAVLDESSVGFLFVHLDLWILSKMMSDSKLWPPHWKRLKDFWAQILLPHTTGMRTFLENGSDFLPTIGCHIFPKSLNSTISPIMWV